MSEEFIVETKDGQAVRVPVSDSPVEPTSHAGRVEGLLRELIAAVEKNTEAVKEAVAAQQKVASETAKASTQAQRAVRAARVRDSAGGGKAERR